ncbi:conjugative transfer ATPase [Xenorhabdus budapestensis]|uniref:Conjugative transfer ATPase n=1 Tax=Xenorhabdus budapestensis TaxID=290110 RepID=A0A2D0IZW6_XENBU|nr:conjugative transfer ATPase [Xenorhabdus budapestensis]
MQEVKELLGRRHKLYRSALTFLVRGKGLDNLNHRVHQLSSTLLVAGLQSVLNAYLRALPMGFNPQKDKKHWLTRLSWVQHLAGLLPMTSRSTGTGQPGSSFFYRGGAPLTFDPMNKQDRTQNAHLLLFGPTGAGKSATLCASFVQLMAIHRPRLFIVEAGNSFGLLADYYASLGLTVNKIGIKLGCGVSLALFADAYQLLQLSPKQLCINEADIPDTDESQDEGDEQSNILGEMEIAARLMITGGEKKEEERLTRSDRGGDP